MILTELDSFNHVFVCEYIYAPEQFNITKESIQIYKLFNMRFVSDQ